MKKYTKTIHNKKVHIVPIRNEQHRAKFLRLIYCDKVQMKSLSRELQNEKNNFFRPKE